MGSSYAVENAASGGHVWAWGSGIHGKLGQGPLDMDDHPYPVEVKNSTDDGYLSNIIAVSGGGWHVLALDNEGHVWAWGWNAYGQLGNNSTNYSSLPVQVQAGEQNPSHPEYALSDIIYIDAGWYYSTAIELNGRVWVWGENGSHLGLNELYPPSNHLRPKLMPNTK